MRTDFLETLVSQECLTCGITFAITATVEKTFRQTKRSFNCPNGHAMNYKGVLEVEELKQKIADLERFCASKEERLSARSNEIEHLNRRISSMKGVISKLRNARQDAR